LLVNDHETRSYAEFIAKQRLRKQVYFHSNERDSNNEETISTLSVPRCYNQNQTASDHYPRVEAGSNTFTVALRVIGGDEKETQCLGL
jgi:hypothetical protein